jgi:hypothetical protein
VCLLALASIAALCLRSLHRWGHSSIGSESSLLSCVSRIVLLEIPCNRYLTV